MLPADMGMGGVSAATAANLEVSGELLKDFQKRVDALLADFEGSAGNATAVGAQTISRASFSVGGGDFHEADHLYTQYNRVHGHLTALSKSLSLQIEATSIAVLGAKNGFANLDEDLRHRFWEIQTQLTEQQNQQREATQAEKAGKEAPKQSDNTQSTVGYN
ncbi:hypothetical protein ACFVTY_15765 [Streptomyces sp. NPDC058067]|uniref:hypothetical protein n=1 Tax=Streptomyces sp. NPDC058067 TaxID=3346324 RepID=UPI0036EC0DB4